MDPNPTKKKLPLMRTEKKLQTWVQNCLVFVISGGTSECRVKMFLDALVFPIIRPGPLVSGLSMQVPVI